MENVATSCILGGDSYLEAEEALGPWLRKLQNDISQASLVVFVGFAAADFHINKVIFNASETKPKTYFLNRSDAGADPDLEMEQGRFGTPLAIGTAELADLIDDALKDDSRIKYEPTGLKRILRTGASDDVSSIKQIEDYLIYGVFQRDQMARDIQNGSDDYRIRREDTELLVEHCQHGGRTVLLTGEICDGKSQIFDEALELAAGTKVVFRAKGIFANLEKEISRILSDYQGCVVGIEQCFALGSERLKALVSQFAGSESTLLLTSRAITAEAQGGLLRELKGLEHFHHLRSQTLSDREVDALIRLSDQITGWTGFPLTQDERRRFVTERCRRRLPLFLLELLKSEVVKNRYLSQFDLIKSRMPRKGIRALVAALYLLRIGHSTHTDLLGAIFHVDVSSELARLRSGNVSLEIARVVDGRVVSIPSVGVTSFLSQVVEDRDPGIVVDTVVEMLNFLAKQPSMNDEEYYIFRQIMRYSIISDVLSEKTSEVIRFFDNVSKIDYCRGQVLFWIQWHMAKVDSGELIEAEEKLDRAYTEAEALERRRGISYDRVQLDDRKAKFLVLKSRKEAFSQQSYSRVREAIQITGRLLHRDDVTHHPYRTFGSIVEFLNDHRHSYSRQIANDLDRRLQALAALGKKRLGIVEEGFRRREASSELAKYRPPALI